MTSQQVAIVGLGLIGTSLGLALRQEANAAETVGFDVDPAAVRQATRAGALSRGCGSLEEACRGSTTVVLAAPVQAILGLLPEVAGHVEPGALVTDTGGTKAEIVARAGQVLPTSVAFVGGHPIAGRLRSGVTAPDGRLFASSVYCLTPTPATAPWGVARAAELVEAVGAQPYFLEAGEHDALLAAVSHLPYFAAVALVRAVASQSGWPEMGALAAGGFRAASSLVDGSPGVWTDVAATNRAPIAAQLDGLINALADLREMIASGDERLWQVLADAHATRRTWLESRDEAPPLADPQLRRRGRGWLPFFSRR